MTMCRYSLRPTGGWTRCAVFALLGGLAIWTGGCQMGPELVPVDTPMPQFALPDYGKVRTLSFEQDDFPAVVPDVTSSIRRSDAHFRDGNHALEWQWQAERSTLTFRVPVPYTKLSRDYAKSGRTVSVFGAWLYSETSRPNATLRISFGRQAVEDCHFRYGLDFTGWRFVCVKFDDMTGTPHPDMNTIALESPEGISSGTIWLDVLQPVFPDDSRWQWPDYQMPFITSRVLNTLHLNSSEARELQARPLDPCSKAHVDTIKRRISDRYIREDFSSKTHAAVRSYIASLHIRRTPHGIQGKTVGTGEIRTYLDHLLKMATLHRSAPRKAKTELERMYVLMCEHLLDQGWAEGSALNAQHHFGYKSRSWAPSVLLMEDSLDRHDLLEPMVRAIIWFGRDFLDYTQPYATYDEQAGRALAGRLADYLNTFSNTHLIALLLLDDTAFKAAALENYRDMLSAMITCPNGALKPDGSFYHHRMHYAGYAVPAMNAFAGLVELIDGTPCEITPQAYQRLKTAFVMAEKWGYPNWAFNACGRHPITGSIVRMKTAFERLAVSVPGTDGVDPELAGICGIIFGNPGPERLQEIPLGKGPAQSFWNMNYAATGIHKWQDTTAIIKGYGNGIRSHETYGKDNRFGRYGSHGTILLFRKDAPDTSGILYGGWDWAQPPGATTLQLPLDLLEGPATAFYGWGPPQKATFSGSGHLDNRYGAFAFSLDGAGHEQSLQVRKSVFAVDGHLICLGSDITNSSAKHETVTTLFQCGGKSLGVRVRPLHFIPDTENCELRIPRSDHSDWFIDPQGNGFLIVPGNDPVVLKRSLQESRHDKTRKPTTGRFVKTWLNHGLHPKAASYEYVIMPETTPSGIESLAQAMDGGQRFYEVLHRNRNCHAVRIPSRQLVFYAFFAAGPCDGAKPRQKGDVIAVDTPVIVLTRDASPGRLDLSVTRPDPSLARPFDAPEPVHTVTITLN
ncbi:MAG: hypothetical protein HON70_25095, partial [Lentisphaerae bacterium]|nr:hypothetical protein [Lentisphaerota bacterium]